MNCIAYYAIAILDWLIIQTNRLAVWQEKVAKEIDREAKFEQLKKQPCRCGNCLERETYFDCEVCGKTWGFCYGAANSTKKHCQFCAIAVSSLEENETQD